jgi:sigma-E factor negative regulatory protein RseB
VDGEIMVTVVGEIPIGTAERIALSVRGGKKPAAKP